MEKSFYRPERRSPRLLGYNYSSGGMFFVTICTKGMQSFFGSVIDGEILLSQAGNIVVENWKSIPEQFSYVSIDEFVVMPNHVHGIVIVRERDDGDVHDRGDAINGVRTFESGVESESASRSKSESFTWQSRYHDHIVRSVGDYGRVLEYIRQNPANWQKDRLFKE